MNRVWNIAIILCLATSCYGQDSVLPPPKITLPNPYEKKIVREYFFENVHFSENNKELVIVAKEPQTQLAEDLAYRIYTDTAFLNRIESEFYRDVDPTSRVVHFCGYDLYFYIKSGNNLKFLRCINSHCGINELGCENVELLASNGTVLSVDTLRTLDFEKLSPKEIIPEDVVYAEYVSSDGIWQDYNSDFTNSCAKPSWWYDGKFQAILKVDLETPVDQFIDKFFRHVDSLEFRNINYKLEYEDQEQLDYFSNVSTHLTELRLNVYLNEDCYHYFDEYTIEPNKRMTEKVEFRDGYLLLLR